MSVDTSSWLGAMHASSYRYHKLLAFELIEGEEYFWSAHGKGVPLLPALFIIPDAKKFGENGDINRDRDLESMLHTRNIRFNGVLVGKWTFPGLGKRIVLMTTPNYMRENNKIFQQGVDRAQAIKDFSLS